jgi:hypothetical protein
MGLLQSPDLEGRDAELRRRLSVLASAGVGADGHEENPHNRGHILIITPMFRQQCRGKKGVTVCLVVVGMEMTSDEALQKPSCKFAASSPQLKNDCSDGSRRSEEFLDSVAAAASGLRLLYLPPVYTLPVVRVPRFSIVVGGILRTVPVRIDAALRYWSPLWLGKTFRRASARREGSSDTKVKTLRSGGSSFLNTAMLDTIFALWHDKVGVEVILP